MILNLGVFKLINDVFLKKKLFLIKKDFMDLDVDFYKFSFFLG